MKEKPSDPVFRQLDTLWQAGLARLTHGISPAGVGGAFYSWTAHLMQSPGRMMEMAFYPALHVQQLVHRVTCERGSSCEPDPRFKSKSWDLWPWRLYAENFLQAEDWWKKATTDIPGLEDHEERIVSFAARQVMDALCPANFPFTNPDLAFATASSGGLNLVRGTWNALKDLQNMLGGTPLAGSEEFKVGKNLAVTPGEVIFRNDLIELIRYKPQTKTVYKEPVLVLPAWIMKYYILDLSPYNSLVNWLVSQGHTVFMVSWKNPSREDRNLGLDDYYRLGAMAAIDAVSKVVPKIKIHLTGYCLGGTLAMITAAIMARDGDDRLKSLSLFAAQGDFAEAGELMLFVTHSEVAFLKNVMEVEGYLDTKQMAGAFQMLRSYDLIWSKIIHDYVEGKRRGMVDLMAWNSDATRMPAKMHGEYLERLFLHNDFADGRLRIDGKQVTPEDISMPVFAVSTEKDHVAPWRSVHKIHRMTRGNVTFVLTAGGHNAGIVSEPGHSGRSFRILEKKAREPYLSPDRWLDKAEIKNGSWWKPWHEWLADQSSTKKITPPAIGKTLCPAPGTYVLQK